MISARLVLYIVDHSPSCRLAWSNVEEAMRGFQPRTLELLVRNLSRIIESERDARDRSVLIVPTLMMIYPHEEYVFGPISVERVESLLRSAGVPPRG